MFISEIRTVTRIRKSRVVTQHLMEREDVIHLLAVVHTCVAEWAADLVDHQGMETPVERWKTHFHVLIMINTSTWKLLAKVGNCFLVPESLGKCEFFN